MFKRLILAVLIVTATLNIGISQASKLRRAKAKMEKLDYIGAISEYNRILALNDDPDAKINIAECYRKISDSENAEYWYGQVVRIPESEPIHKLFYAQALQKNGKCDLAKEWYVKFVDETPDDLRGQYLVKACDYEEELMTKNAGLYEIKHMDFNSSLDDFGPAYYEDGILFASERDKGGMVSRIHSWTGAPFLDVYYVDTQEEATDDGSCGNIDYGRPEKFSSDLNGKFHDSNPILSNDKSTIFFTRNNGEGKSDDGTVLLKIYYAEKKGEHKFGKLVGLPFNSDEYNVAHPALSLDGEKLYFSSDMPGGFGGMDLYVSEKDGGNWGPPSNLGPQINTEGNEIFPFYSADSKLYFSSNGHVGLGGLDIYHMDDKGDGEFGQIINIGYPLNTVSDDFCLIFNESNTCGYFSSDRTGGAGNDDIYSFAKIAAPLEIFVFDEVTKEPIVGATVVDDCSGTTYTTDEEGKAYGDIKLSQCCTYKASKELYVDNEKEGCSTAELTEKVFVEIPMAKEMQFDLEGVTFDGSSSLPLEGVLVTLTNDCGDEDQTATSDEDGRFYFKLRDDCCYSLNGAKLTYSDASESDQCTKGLTESTTLQANLTLNPQSIADAPQQPNNNFDTGLPQTTPPPSTGVYNKDGILTDAVTDAPYTGDLNGQIVKDGQVIGGESGGFTVSPTGTHPDANGVSYLLHIYYDFDQSYIRDEAVPDLERLLALMNDHPSYIIEIGSHTDSRGSKRYNTGLSDRRARSVVKWLKKRGIDASRLVSRGYGETIHVNDCTDNVHCSEAQHQFNRRTEFKVIGCSTCVEGGEGTYSQPKTAPKVDKCNNCPF